MYMALHASSPALIAGQNVILDVQHPVQSDPITDQLSIISYWSTPLPDKLSAEDRSLSTESK